MASQEPQTITLSRRMMLLIMLGGISVLTVCYVLGVHVGRQSSALSCASERGVGEDLHKLPAAIQDQIKALDYDHDSKDTAEQEQEVVLQAAAIGDARIIADSNKVLATVKAVVSTPSKSEPRGTEKKAEDTTRWTTQLISTPDISEAQRMMGKVQASGFSAVIVTERGLFKVRLTKTCSREGVDATMVKLKNRGFKPFAVRVG